MGRKSKKLARKTSSNNRNEIARVRLHETQSAAMISGQATVSLSPATFTSLSSLAGQFDMYKVTRLRFRMHPATSTTIALAACYIPGISDNLPVGTVACAQVSDHTYIGGDTTVPSSWCQVPSAGLKGYMNWYKTVVGSPDAAEEVQGVIRLGGSSTEVYQLEVEATYLFKNLLPDSATPMTPAERGARETIALRDKLLRVMGHPGSCLPLQTKK